MMTLLKKVGISIFAAITSLSLVYPGAYLSAAEKRLQAQQVLGKLESTQGICAVLGDAPAEFPTELAQASKLTIFAQLSDPRLVEQARQFADRAGILGSRVYIEQGSLKHIHLADNLADAVVDFQNTSQKEVLRVLRPQGRALVGNNKILVKPVPKGIDQWSHPYHGPDNNPQSSDQLARGPYMTHFLAEPWFGPMPEVTVVSGGRMFKAFGHISFKQREWPLLNKLIAINAYNGTPLWQRDLQDGFMVHRNTLIATPKTLYLADDRSCKLLDASSGVLVDEIIPPDDISPDKVWKWMALTPEKNILLAMLGPEEQKAVVINGTRTAAGWPWSGLGKGYAQEKYPWGFGNIILAFDLSTKKVLWGHQEDKPLDSRATSVSNGKLFFYSHENFVACLDTTDGRLLWKTTDRQTLSAIGQHDRAQTPSKGYSTTSFVKSNDQAMYFAGPQRRNLVAISAKDGKLLWQYPHGNYQLVIRDDALYALGRTDTSKKFALTSGQVLADLECFRGNCTRATGTIDSIFSRGYRHTGTQRILLEGDRSTRIGLMRPACQDGVIVAGGLLYWGPWMCDCNLQLVGVISLGPAEDFQSRKMSDNESRLQHSNENSAVVTSLKIDQRDWPAYRGNNRRQSGTIVQVPKAVKQLWQYRPASKQHTTAAVTAAGMTFFSGDDGVIRSFDSQTGKEIWQSYTGGAVRYSPSLMHDRLFVGSNDGWVYALEAASGRQLWRFRAAPTERKIPVYGKLSSTWPVAGGVLTADGIVYAAAGIASYDGTYVYALNAKTGRPIWTNDSSGSLIEDDLAAGVSVQGHLLLNRDKLYMAGGNVTSPAVYDINTGECLNKLDDEWTKAARGRDLFLVDDQVRAFDQLLYSPKGYQVGRYFSESFTQASSGDILVRGRPGQIIRISQAAQSEKKPTGLWAARILNRASALAVAGQTILGTGRLSTEAGSRSGEFALVALDAKTGKTQWFETIPSAPDSWGLAVDRDGRILVTLADGGLVCFGEE